MGDLRLRQAVAHALEKHDIITNTYQNHGVAVDVPVLRTAGWPSGSWAWNTTPSARGSS